MKYQPLPYLKMLLASVVFLAVVTSVKSQADVIEADSFTTNQGSLQNRPVEVPQTAGDEWNIANSSDSNLVVSNGELEIGPNGGFAKAIAPFDASSITVPYTLSYTLSFNPGTNTTTTFYGGFGNGTGNGATFSDYSGAAMFGDYQDSTGTSFTLSAGNGPTTTLSTTITRASTSVDYTMNLSININPTTDVTTFYVNGNSIGTTTYSGQVGGLWFKEDQGGSTTFTGFDISNLQVTTTPEPSTYALMAVGLLALGALLRLRRRA